MDNLDPITLHQPVMKQEVLALLLRCPKPYVFLDATFGRGGHTCLILDNIEKSHVYGIDRDPEALAFAQEKARDYSQRLQVRQGCFSALEELFLQQKFSGILIDCGVSSPQIDQAERGFSFQKDGPLDMRMSLQGKTAADWLQSATERELADIFFHYGQERKSFRIARHIVQARRRTPFKRTQQLATFIEKISPRTGKLHPATRVFQALRIAVNQELQELEVFLPKAYAALNSGGCLIVIAFHSLEDAISKRFFKSHDFQEKSKKPLMPSEEERKSNPRSRSARLRYGWRS